MRYFIGSSWGYPFQFLDRLGSKTKLSHTLGEFSTMVERGEPECGHIGIALDDKCALDPLHYDCGEGNDRATGEWFNQRIGIGLGEPFLDMRDKPSLTTGVPQWAV